uniref:Uncharacterized protein n=1 Tax=Amphimedon queenslandica TaxID=400682 RepID=A0A1X7SWM7_AMPQE
MQRGTKRSRQSTVKGKELSQYYKEPCKDVWCTVELMKTDASIKKEYHVKSNYLETEL